MLLGQHDQIPVCQEVLGAVHHADFINVIVRHVLGQRQPVIPQVHQMDLGKPLGQEGRQFVQAGTIGQAERELAEREERLISAAQMEARKTVLAAKQAVMEETYAKALEKLRNLPEARYVEVLTELLLQAAPHGAGEVLFSAQDRETVGQAAVDAANGKSGGKLTLSGETAPIQGGFILKDGNVEVNCAFDTLVRLQKAETAGQVAQRLFG